MTQDAAARAIIAYMGAKRYQIDTQKDHLNIVYLEGINPDFTANKDAFDAWNDLSLIIEHNDDGQPHIIFSAVATTEPGRASTYDLAAKKLGGVARIAFGQYTAWRVGFHRAARLYDTHPALVQCAPLPVYRDLNRDGIRTGDPMGWARGINQHSTSANYKGDLVGFYSAGCLVRKMWNDHLKFMEIVKSDVRYLSNPKYVFTTTIIDGNDFLRTFVSENEMKAPA